MTRELRRLTFNLERTIIDWNTNRKIKATPLNVEPVVVWVDIRNIKPKEGEFDERLHIAVLRGFLDSLELKAAVDAGVAVLPGPRGGPGLYLRRDANAYVAGEKVRCHEEGYVWIPVQLYRVDE